MNEKNFGAGTGNCLTNVTQHPIEASQPGRIASCASGWCGVLRDWYVIRLWAQFGIDHKVFNELSQTFRCHMVTEVRVKLVRRRNHTVYQDGKPLEEISLASKFPSFLFVSWDEGDDRWPLILEVPGVKSIFRRAGSTLPAKLPRGWVESFQIRGRPGDGVFDERFPPTLPIEENTVVRVLDGAWKNWTATVQACRGDEVTALMNVLSGTIRLKLKRNTVEAI